MSIAPRPTRISPSRRTLLRVGAVNYLNSKPLIEGLCENDDDAELTLDYPSRLADDLASGELDVALIPSVEALAHPDYKILSNACVSAHGPVLSVKLYSRVSPGMIRTLALDEGSRTSCALVKTYLSHRFGVHPETRPFPLNSKISETDADAILMIGDRAMHAPPDSFHTVWDLGEQWQKWTGLPFVFAVWAARAGDWDHIAVAKNLEAARDRGVAQIENIARREASQLGITDSQATHYLKHNLHFYLGSAEREGFRLFRNLAVEANIIPGDSDVVFHSA